MNPRQKPSSIFQLFTNLQVSIGESDFANGTCRTYQMSYPRGWDDPTAFDHIFNRAQCALYKERKTATNTSAKHHFTCGKQSAVVYAYSLGSEGMPRVYM
jgi:hypothetical protein